jgi:multimeric flavodoxin WrbA
MTRVLAINGSARMEKGYTATVLGHFLEGAREGGATVELVYAKKLKIRPCIGDFQCWYEKVGECIQNDDMQMLYEKLKHTEILVIASPIYFPLPGELQNLLNRLMPLIEPILEFRDGRTRAKFHDDVKIYKVVLVGTSGWWEVQNLDLVVEFVKHMAADASIEYGGAVLRPHASLMKENKEKAEEVNTALKQAGYQLIKEGKMAPELLKIIQQPLISEQDLRSHYNRMYQKAKRERP